MTLLCIPLYLQPWQSAQSHKHHHTQCMGMALSEKIHSSAHSLITVLQPYYILSAAFQLHLVSGSTLTPSLPVPQLPLGFAPLHHWLEPHGVPVQPLSPLYSRPCLQGIKPNTSAVPKRGLLVRYIAFTDLFPNFNPAQEALAFVSQSVTSCFLVLRVPMQNTHCFPQKCFLMVCKCMFHQHSSLTNKTKQALIFKLQRLPLWPISRYQCDITKYTVRKSHTFLGISPRSNIVSVLRKNR